MAPSRSTPQMMQATRAAFRAHVSPNEQATDPKSHTLVSNFYTRISPVPLPAIPMVDPYGSSYGSYGSYGFVQIKLDRSIKGRSHMLCQLAERESLDFIG